MVTDSRLWGWEVQDGRLPLDRLRASDDERDLTVDHLTTAFVEGRLGHEEYDHRVGLALGATLLGELSSLTADLPAPESSVPAFRPDLPGYRAPRSRPRPRSTPRFGHDHPTGAYLSALSVPWHEWGDEWRWWLGVAVALTGVWGVGSLVGGGFVAYWPLVPLGIWAAVLLASAIWPSGEDPP